MWTQLRLWAARLSADGATVRVEHLDLADQASVLAFLARWDGPAHLLVNNAGVIATRVRDLAFPAASNARCARAPSVDARCAADTAGARRIRGLTWRWRRSWCVLSVPKIAFVSLATGGHR